MATIKTGKTHRAAERPASMGLTYRSNRDFYITVTEDGTGMSGRPDRTQIKLSLTEASRLAGDLHVLIARLKADDSKTLR